MGLPADFSLRSLYEALDAQRGARGLSWAQATREMKGQSKARPFSPAAGPAAVSHALSTSTVQGTRMRAVAEGDGVLQMLRWLNRTPESFVPGHPQAESVSARLPVVPAGRVLRFDTKRIFAALDLQRRERKMTWMQVATEAGVGVSSLRHLSQGGRTAFPQVMRILRWLGRPAARFTRVSPH
ncbi:MAG: hypothetical protein ACRD33_01195 [Candidatus Acidiferrales bacterium]